MRENDHYVCSTFFRPVGFAAPDLPDLPRLFDWHRAYVCPCCGDAWAKWRFPLPRPGWTTVSRSCPVHRSFSSERPGSLIVNVGLDILLLPPPLLIRELDL
jgi:hypothetical protein